MLIFPQIDPVAVKIGPLQIHWYGLMYVVGILAAWYLGIRRAKQSFGHKVWEPDEISNLITYAAFGMIIGGRIGYMVFYYYPAFGFLSNPFEIFRIWNGGMAFHGGLVGALIALWFYAKQTERYFFAVADFVAPLVPLGLGAGRLGNFINGELWGKPTTVSWGMVFSHVDKLPRHPSQLYEAFLEGFCLFILVWWYSSKPRPRMAVTGLFLIGYACARIIVEFFREPDEQLGYILFNTFTMGQLLSLPLFIFGCILMWFASKRGKLI